MDRAELRELVDAPLEKLEVEYKGWLDLGDRLTQAKVARHLCALSNHGGGYLVFGINDDGTTSGSRPEGVAGYDQDRLSGIVKQYLAPAFQVRMHEVRASSGILHPVVWVPPHGAVPVCSKRAGPDGKGISVGTHYTRGVGPASEPVTTADAWARIIRRCVIHDRQSLLAAFEGALRPPVPAVDAESQHRRWHEAARAAFVAATVGDRDAALLERAHVVLSYRVGHEGEGLDATGFVDELGKISHETKQLVDSGWPMFVVFHEPGLRPRSRSDQAAGVEEFLECRFVGPERKSYGVPELWRSAPEGLGALVRGYCVEDVAERRQGIALAAGQRLARDWAARDIAELIRHARAFSERFEAAATVSFRAEWRGLAGRRVIDTRVPMIRELHDVATDDAVAVARTVGVAELVDGWPALTAEMLSRVLRVFNAGSSVSAEDIATWSEDWRR